MLDYIVWDIIQKQKEKEKIENGEGTIDNVLYIEPPEEEEMTRKEEEEEKPKRGVIVIDIA